MLPDVATLYLAGASSKALDTGFWQSVYGFSMEPIAASIAQESQGKAVIADVPASAILTEAVALRSFDLTTIGLQDTDFSSEFVLPVKREVRC